MDYLIYYKIADPLLVEGMYNIIDSISDSSHSCGNIILIKNSSMFERMSSDIIVSLRDYFLNKPLHLEDELYIFYPNGKQIGLNRLKKRGRAKVHRYIKSMETAERWMA